MKEDIKLIVEIPEGIEMSVNGGTISAKSGDKEISKLLDLTNISAKVEGNNFILESKKATKRESKMIHTINAHVKNMIKGLQEGFEYKLEIAFSHFPMTVEVQGDELIIKNFLGEKKNRTADLLKGTEVSVDGKFVTVKSHNIEIAGQTAANIEKSTHIRNKDRRKFQDGIYISEKPRRKI